MKKKLIVVISILVILVSITIILFIKPINTSDIVAVVEDKIYSTNQFEKKYGVKILSFDFIKVRVSNGDNYYDCFYNHICEIWPDSKNGMIMWEAPLVYVKFKRK